MNLQQWRQRVNWLDLTLVLVGLALAAALRASLLSHETRDYVVHTSSWYATLKEQGFGALAGDFANYPPLYLYLQYLMTLLAPNLDPNIAIKLISLPFDLVCAFFVFKLARLRFASTAGPLVAFFATLFAPTMVLNSAMWGQADAIYTAGILACIYFVITRRHIAAFIALGLAFSIKLQALFIAPWLVVLWLRRMVPLRVMLLVPIVFVASLVPAWLAGRPWLDLLTVYVGQANQYLQLTLNFPNLYAWIPNQYFDLLSTAGVVFAASIGFLYVLMFARQRAPLSTGALIGLALLSLLLVPYTLPRMHDRYFFPADVLSLAYLAYFPAFFAIPVIVNLSSLFPYITYLFGQEVVPLNLLAMIVLGGIAVLTWQLVRLVQTEDAASSNGHAAARDAIIKAGG